MELCTSKNIQKIINELNEYANLPSGWDNESDKPTDPTSIKFAKWFAKMLKGTDILPIVSCATGDEVALYWKNDSLYFIIHFFEDGKVKFYYDNQETSVELHGVYNVEYNIPDEVYALVPKVNN